jgi:hypothetical protein
MVCSVRSERAEQDEQNRLLPARVVFTGSPQATTDFPLTIGPPTDEHGVTTWSDEHAPESLR